MKRLASLLTAVVMGSSAQADELPDFPLIRYDTAAVASDAAPPIFDWGGEVRQRYEYTHNPGFGAEPQDERGAWLQRWSAFGDLHAGEHLRLFAEFHSVLESGRAAGPGPTDQNELELQNAFVEWRAAAQSGPDLLVRVGRQELQFGSARIVSVRDGPNVRRTFDGIRAVLQASDWQFSAFAVQPRKDDLYVFDDSSDTTRKLWGVYATRLSSVGGIDLYYAGYENDVAVFDQGQAAEHRHTLGLRLFGSHNGWSWNWEPMLQFGSFGGADLRGRWPAKRPIRGRSYGCSLVWH